MRLTYRFCDDWLIYAQAEDGSWWYTVTETWPEWLDVAAEKFGVDPEAPEVLELAASLTDEGPHDMAGRSLRGPVARYMVPQVTAWNTESSPTASPVSRPDRLDWARWERAREEDWADLENHPRR